jgi:hypothetical protein
MTLHVDLSNLDEPLFADDYEWVDENAGVYLKQVESALKAGATPADIYSHYMQIAPHRQALWLRLKHAAHFLQARQS